MLDKYITAGNLAKVEPGAHCWGCGKQADQSPADETWVILSESILYCRECAERKGVLQTPPPTA